MKSSWTEDFTHQSRVWWAIQIQKLIRESSSPSEDPKHDQTDTREWLKKLVDLVMDRFPATGTYDENMRGAMVMSAVLLYWGVRVKRAKTQDPCRPNFERGTGYHQWLEFVREVFDIIVDESDDSTIFPGQEWQSPFTPQSKNGDFV